METPQVDKLYLVFVCLFVIAFIGCDTPPKQAVNRDNLIFISHLETVKHDTSTVNRGEALTYVRLEIRHSKQGTSVTPALSEVWNLSLKELEYYLSYAMKNDIYVLCDEKKHQPVLFHYERSYGVRKAEIFSMAFDLKRNKQMKLRFAPQFAGFEPVIFGLKPLGDKPI